MTQADVFGRLGSFCVRHRRWVIVAWVAFVVGGGVLGSAVFNRLGDGSLGSDRSESKQGSNLLHAVNRDGDNVIGIVDDAPLHNAATRRAFSAAAHDNAAMPLVDRIREAYSDGDPSLRSRDGRASLVIATISDNLSDSAEERVAGVIRDRLRDIPVGRVTVGGDALMWPEITNHARTDAERGEAVAFPLALIALVFVFGGLRAASVPLISAATAISGTFLLLLGATYVTSVAVYAINIVTLFGLGLAIDYSLLAVNRFREERATGLDVHDSVVATTASAGRTVAFSAMTVVASLAGLLMFRDGTFRSLAVGGICVTLVAVAAALTFTPALLATLGAKVSPRASSDTGAFARLAARVQRRPIPIVIVVGILLLAAGAPFLHARYIDEGPDSLPTGSAVRQVADTLAARFPGQQVQPVTVVTVTKPGISVQSYADQLRQRSDVVAVRERHGVLDNRPYGGGVYSVTALDLVPAKGAQSQSAQALVRDLRAHRPPYTTFVTGEAAFLVDFKHTIGQGLPWALLIVCGTTLLLLFLMTGSVVIPIKALVMNFLSLGATFGVLVWVFQDGHLVRLLGATPSPGLQTVVPIIAFVFAFGLSMDYEVFLIARMQELVQNGVPNDRAVATALQRSGRVITSAALLMVIVFLGFTTAGSVTVKEMGVALSTAVLVDVTLVRCLLVPATMTLLGTRNWWAPRPLRKVWARFGLHEHPTVDVPEPVSVVD